MTATNPRDAETVRALLRRHLPSGFPNERAPLTVGDVACRMVSEHQRGAERLTDDELVTARSLLNDNTIIPDDERLTGRRVKETLAVTGVEMSDRFWMRFQGAAIVMLLGRNGGPSVVFACERMESPS